MRYLAQDNIDGSEVLHELAENVANVGDQISGVNWDAWLVTLAFLGGAAIVGLIVHAIVFSIAARFAREHGVLLTRDNLNRLKRPLRVVFPLLATQIMLHALIGLRPNERQFIGMLLSIGNITAMTWLVVVGISIIEQHIKLRHRVDVVDNLEARRVHTQISVLSRTLMVFVIIIGAAAALMVLPRMREVGTAMLASAGLAGLAIGLAARPVLENLIAGVQLALTQPIRLDDVVVVDGEFGRIEEITTTYVVVRLWDQRRLIVPFSKFISESFENWTRQSAENMGTVFLHADYRVPVQAVREEAMRLVEASDKWDGRSCSLAVTDATAQSVQLRVVVSARNSGDAWDLRIMLREKLLEFLQREHPEALPRTRVEVDKLNRDSSVN